MSIAELIGTKYVLSLNMKRLSSLQKLMLHAIASRAVSKWAQEKMSKRGKGHANDRARG